MITAIEQGIVNVIKTANTVPANEGGLGYRLKTVKSYGGELSGKLADVAAFFPFVLVAFSGLRKLRSLGTRTEYEVFFAVICAAKSLRNEEEQRRGGSRQPGSYQILEDCFSRLHGNMLGLDISPLEIVRIDPLVNERGDRDNASIYGMEVSTRVTLPGTLPPDGRPGLFATFHANWDIPVLGNVGPEIPDDANADATDHVTLEQ